MNTAHYRELARKAVSEAKFRQAAEYYQRAIDLHPARLAAHPRSIDLLDLSCLRRKLAAAITSSNYF